MKKFPKCFPSNFETEILPKGAREHNKAVYRIIKCGIINKDSFISTFEEIQRGLIPRKKRLNLNDPGIYSTSCNIEYAEAQHVLDVFMRHYPKPIIAKGETEAVCGPSQLTSEREERTDTHVDWWIYEDVEPQQYFSEVKDE